MFEALLQATHCVLKLLEVSHFELDKLLKVHFIIPISQIRKMRLETAK